MTYVNAKKPGTGGHSSRLQPARSANRIVGARIINSFPHLTFFGLDRRNDRTVRKRFRNILSLQLHQ